MNGLALPSMIGISGASTSMIILSIPKPANAAFKCSTVETRTPCSFTSAVQSIVSRTESAFAGKVTGGLRSVRQ